MPDPGKTFKTLQQVLAEAEQGHHQGNYTTNAIGQPEPISARAAAADSGYAKKPRTRYMTDGSVNYVGSPPQHSFGSGTNEPSNQQILHAIENLKGGGTSSPFSVQEVLIFAALITLANYFMTSDRLGRISPQEKFHFAIRGIIAVIIYVIARLLLPIFIQTPGSGPTITTF